jgi:predicted N-formylglutamate amidohydrolase
MYDRAVFDLVNPHGHFPLVLTCEHASYAVPEVYHLLGLDEAEIRRHIGWDIGARDVVESLAQALDAPAVCSAYSRLLIDCNRDLNDHDLIVPESDGTKVPGNMRLSETERQSRIETFYEPYHAAIDRLLICSKETRKPTVLSIHSFTPILDGKERLFDLGILFDRYDDLAQEIGQRLQQQGYRVRYNEPYSGYDGLIFSARSHGERHELVYLELEINNSLINHAQKAAQMGRRLSEVLRPLFSTDNGQQESSR